VFANYTTLTTLEQIKKILESTQEYTRDSIGIDLYDAEKNHIIESVVIMGIN
jgi:hypothetical protein